MRLQKTFEGHTGLITSTAFSPDGRLVVSGSRDRTVRLWSVPQGQALATFSGHTEPVTGVAFHPTGRWIASSSADGAVRAWDVSSLDNAPTPQVFPLQAGAVNCLEWSPDGAWLVAGCQNGAIHLLALHNGAKLTTAGGRILSGHSAAVTCLAFSDAGQLASGAQDRTIRFWNLATGKEIDYWATSTAPNTLVFTPRFAVALTWGQPELFGVMTSTLDKSNNSVYGTIHSAAVRQVRLARDGSKQRLLTASADGTIKLWKSTRSGGDHLLEEAVARRGNARRLGSGQHRCNRRRLILGRRRLRRWTHPSLGANRTTPAHVRGDGRPPKRGFYRQRNVLITPGWLRDYSRGWDRFPQTFYPAGITALEIHADNQRFAYGDKQGALAIGNFERSGEPVRCHGHTQEIAGMAASPDGKHLASASADGTVKLWSWDTGACQRTVEPGLGPLHALAWSRAGDALALTGERGVAVCDLAGVPKVRLLQQHSLRVSSVALFADLLAFSGPQGTVEICNVHTGKKLHSLHAHQRVVSALAFSPDGKVLASGAAGDPMRLWDTTKEFAQRDLDNQPAELWRWITFDPQGRYLAACKEGTGWSGVYCWDLRSQPPAPTGRIEVYCGRFTADASAFLSADSRGSVQRWTMAEIEQAQAQAKGKALVAGSTFVTVQGRATTLVNGGHTRTVWGVAASPDGRWIATASHDRTVKLWDARTRKLVRTLEGHHELVWCVAFSPDSQYLASGSVEGSSGCVKVWEVATGREHRQFLGHQRLVFGVAFHPNGRLLASSSVDGSVCLWDVAGGKSLGLLHQFDRSVYSVRVSPGRALLGRILPG